MANVTYGSLFTDIETKYKSIQKQRSILSERRKAGEKSIESLRRVHPRTTPRFWYDRLARIKGIKSEMGSFTGFETKLSTSEAELKKQEKSLKEKQSAGWKIRKKGEGYEYFKPAPKVSSSRSSAGGGFSVRVKWKTKSGEVRSFVGNVKNTDSWRNQISNRGGQILSIVSLGSGRNVRRHVPKAKETVGGGLMIYEYKPEEITSTKIADTTGLDIQEIDTTGKTSFGTMPSLDVGGRGVQVLAGDTFKQSTIKAQITPVQGQMSTIPTTGRKKGEVWFTPKKSTDWKWGDVSPYKEEFGYDPKDFDFTTEIDKTTGNIGLTEKSIATVESSLPIITKNIESIESQIASIEGSGQKTFKFQGVANVFDKEGAKKYLQAKLQEQKGTFKTYEKSLPELKSSLSQMKESKTTLIDYKGKGYTLDVKEDAYEFGLPSAVDVHKFVYTGKVGYKQPSILEQAGALIFPPIGLATSVKQGLAGLDAHSTQLAMSSLVQSPLGIGAVASGIASGVTGDEGFTKRSQEKIAEYSLGLKSSLKKGGFSFAGKVISSGAVVSGVILPTVTLGTGYVLTGVGAGASGVAGATSTTLGRFGATTLGRASLLGTKGGLVAVGGIGAVSTGATLLRTKVESPYDLPSAIAETGFTIGLAYGSFKAGGKLFKSRMPKIKTVDVKATDLEVFQDAPKGGVTKFELSGKYDIEGTKADVMFKGAGYKVGKEMHVSTGRGSVKWTDKGGAFKRLTGIGKEKSHYKILDADTTADLIIKGKYENIYRFKGSSQMLSGKKGYYAYGYQEPVGSEGYSSVLKEPFTFKETFYGKVYPKELGKIKIDLFSHKGEYSGMFQKGTMKLSGKIFKLPQSLSKTGGKLVKTKGKGKILEDWSGKARMGDAKEGQQFFFSKSIKPTTGRIPEITTSYGDVGQHGEVGVGIFEEVGILLARTIPKDVVTTPTGLYGGGLGGLVKKGKQGTVTSGKTKLASALGTKQISKVAQKSETRIDTRLKSLLSLSTAKVERSAVATSELTIQGTRSKELEKFDFGTISLTDTAQAQEQKQKLAVTQKSKMAYGTAKKSIFDVITITDTVPTTPFTPAPILWGGSKVKPKKKTKVGRPRKRAYRLGKKRIALKTILADPFSVQTSQIKYGKATTPKITKQIWEEFQRTGKVKTVEMRDAIVKKAKSDKIDFDYITKGGGATKKEKVTFDFNILGKKKKKKGGKK